MAGDRVPLVVFPRFTTHIGQSNFFSLALDVQAYAGVELAVWRGPVLSSGAFTISTWESIDRQRWSQCFGPQDQDPTANTEALYLYQLSKKWFRVQLVLGGSNPGVTWWAQGFLVNRER